MFVKLTILENNMTAELSRLYCGYLETTWNVETTR